MPIFRAAGTAARRLGLLLGLSLLAACVGGGGADEAGVRDVQVTSDRVTITGPQGFCVDPTATRDTGATGFVLMGNCAAITGAASAEQPNVSAVLTATIAAPSPDPGLAQSISGLDGVFRSEQGRSLLSRSGDATDVEILDTQMLGNVFLLHARDTSDGNIDGVAQDYWRAYLQIGPRLATLSVLALAEANISEAAALGVLQGYVLAVQQANSAELPQRVNEPLRGPFRAGLFRRIF